MKEVSLRRCYRVFKAWFTLLYVLRSRQKALLAVGFFLQLIYEMFLMAICSSSRRHCFFQVAKVDCRRRYL